MTGPGRARADRALDHAYAQIPDAGCRGLCQSGCDSIAMSVTEQARIRERHGRFLPLVAAFNGALCPALDEDGRCAVYEDRPFVCRAWGAVEMMPCPHGCVPDEGRLPESYARRLKALVWST